MSGLRRLARLAIDTIAKTNDGGLRGAGLSGLTPAQAFDAAIALHRQGQLSKAEQLYRALLDIDPRHFGALYNLGLICTRSNRLDEAVALLRRAADRDPSAAPAYNSLGIALTAAGHAKEAIVPYEVAVRLAPGDAKARNNLGNALLTLHRYDEALEQFRAALAIRPDLAEPHCNLGNVYAALGRFEDAVAQYRDALAINPQIADAHNNLGNVLLSLRRQEEAVRHFAAAIALRPDMAEAHSNLGKALVDLDRHDQAIHSYRKAIEINPQLSGAHSNLGNALATLGRIEEAGQAHEQAVALAPGQPQFYRSLAASRKFTLDDPYLAAMEGLAARAGSLSTDDRLELHFALGKAYADVGRHDPSFQHLLAGNALKRQMMPYDEATTLRLFDRISAAFDPRHMQLHPQFGDASRVPVLVVGMPRSGTTLVEQILASHPSVHGAGELSDINALVAQIPEAFGVAGSYPECASILTAAQLREFGGAYVAGLRRRSSSAERIVDKMPGNFIFLGLIRLALPGARIIHVIRDPLDTCLSCFSKLFDSGLAYTYNLGELGRYYAAYRNLMAHWRLTMPAEAILDVHYEALVADVGSQARRMIAYCDLAWDDRCLNFHQTERSVRTSSAYQVRQPIYQSSIGRSLPYHEMLRPLREALGMA